MINRKNDENDENRNSKLTVLHIEKTFGKK